MKILNLALFFAVGLLGGVVSHYIWSQPVHAQSSVSDPTEVRARSFVLVDKVGIVQGKFTVGRIVDGKSVIVILDRNGKEMWEVGGVTGQILHPASN
jgi:hypothetical protein